MSFLRNCWQVAAYGREVMAGRRLLSSFIEAEARAVAA